MSSITPIGIVRTPFKEKFGIPKQPHLANEVQATIEIATAICAPESFEQLEGFNFIWLLGCFHLAESKSTKVRPPKLGGNEKVGVFATRSPFRPNPLSLSLVKLISIHHDEASKKMILTISGIDLVNETPVFDIKPYIPSHDTPWEPVKTGWVEDSSDKTYEVIWSDEAKSKVKELEVTTDQQKMINSILKIDPRPAYHNSHKSYFIVLDQFDIEFTVQNHQVIILNIKNSTR
ncbi:MAG: tRNA (N6-threonylcarbamoyladenosine(37)-N6)-methyltransferase TrmO [Bdellovibrionales bacterium CG12_big_fil_rev_8_21_14_0_65_38_15]|nr:MAG: tRNA (N6-threonylcarbamoyladenosine(37)-N6)-methyltransferase TrmO [Bdellovibrionales bacterium CG22_combo_CG10-13_8_21_14_all_38_13]PIQ53524.1 MAG: tRNA (N6-threonylcarbamoyladenosine(37)-N6)-methyltransferase TrmO [Bdellovibrionales bacterium CG12_big_fil_rev_8_21_14_0_65_38_15]PIR28472.1 MAG: tRNA (N6-threonylcarbamoyladenosine(37)-N6)-methyltransferase TrmO [Bdellovibrionales bacterium CG11_big_fil_rev_8_21_14_0_20_38_13]